jgi:predicted glycosyltransferase
MDASVAECVERGQGRSNVDASQPRRAAWIDVENPPQVQYLIPFVAAFRRMGYAVIVTARDHGAALELLRMADAPFTAIGRQHGAARTRKVVGTLGRAIRLRDHIRHSGGADLVLCGSRSGALAAWKMGVPAFVIVDYEHVELRSYRRLGASILFPSVIGSEAFRRQGIASDRLMPFPGIKEDFSFAGRDLTVHEPRELGIIPKQLYRVLVRPPAEDSHYFKASSRALTEQALRTLAQRRDIQVILSPRRPEQRALLDAERWINKPIVLERAVPFIDLLGSVDGVVCSGGTMLREAAYLGVPAIGIFAGPIGGVDAHLASSGAARLVRSARDLQELDWRMPRRSGIIAHHPDLVDVVAREISAQAQRRHASRL